MDDSAQAEIPRIFNAKCGCGRVLKATTAMAGKRARCPTCQRVMRLPVETVVVSMQTASSGTRPPMTVSTGTAAAFMGGVALILTFVVPHVSIQQSVALVLFPAWGVLTVLALSTGIVALCKVDGWGGGAVAVLIVAVILLQFDFASPDVISADPGARSPESQEAAEAGATHDRPTPATPSGQLADQKAEPSIKVDSPTPQPEKVLPNQRLKKSPTPLEGDWVITQLKWSEVNSTRSLMVSKPGLWLSCRGGEMRRIVGTGNSKSASTDLLEVDSSRKPYRFVRSRMAGSQWKIVERGIFSVDGDTLRICVNESGPALPTSFSIVQGRDVKNKYLYTFKRTTQLPATKN